MEKKYVKDRSRGVRCVKVAARSGSKGGKEVEKDCEKEGRMMQRKGGGEGRQDSRMWSRQS